MSNHHWYASTRTDWVVADTKENVIKKLAQISGKGEALVCQVNAPITARYLISEYLPHGVDREPAKRVTITARSGKYTE